MLLSDILEILFLSAVIFFTLGLFAHRITMRINHWRKYRLPPRYLKKIGIYKNTRSNG